MALISRRGVLGGLLAAPAIIKTQGLLMPVRALPTSGAITGRWVSGIDPAFLESFTRLAILHYAHRGPQPFHKQMEKLLALDERIGPHPLMVHGPRRG